MSRQPHASITEDRVVAMCMRQLTTLDNPGICIACGVEADGCDPDAREDKCEACGEPCVMGAQQILIAGCYHPDKGVSAANKPADWSATQPIVEVNKS